MDNIKCFEVVVPIVDEATSQFAPLWVLNRERYDILLQYCDAIDNLSNEFHGEAIEVEVDDINMTISISLECWDMKLSSTSHIFYRLYERAISSSFSSSGDGNLCIKFIFPSIWEKI